METIFINTENSETNDSNNKFKVSAPTLNDEFDLPDGSYSISDIQDCFEDII